MNTQQQIILLPWMTTASRRTSARLNILLYTKFTELLRQEPYTSIELSSFEVQNIFNEIIIKQMLNLVFLSYEEYHADQGGCTVVYM